MRQALAKPLGDGWGAGRGGFKAVAAAVEGGCGSPNVAGQWCAA